MSCRSRSSPRTKSGVAVFRRGGHRLPPSQSQWAMPTLLEITMSQLDERIAQFRKMATEDPDNDLGHFRLGQLLMENGQHDEALKSFERTAEINPHFSKVFQLQGECLTKLGRNA